MTIVFAQIHARHRNTVPYDAFRYACESADYGYNTIVAKARAVILRDAIDNETVLTTFQPLIAAYTGYNILVRSFDILKFYSTLQSLIAEGSIDIATQLVAIAIPTQDISVNSVAKVSELTDGAINGYVDSGIVLLKKNAMTEQVAASRTTINRLLDTPTITLSSSAAQKLIETISKLIESKKLPTSDVL